MSDNVVYLDMITRLDTPPERVLDNAPRDMSGVVVMGYTADGDEYFASSYADGGEVLWIMERCKKRLMEMPETIEECDI